MKQRCKIVEFRAENLKRITVVEIRPDGPLVQITGKNGQGKTSVLDGIWWAIDGKKNIQKKPIRDGAESAIIRLDLGTLKVVRTFTRTEDGGDYTTDLKVTREDGTKIKSAQGVLDALTDALSFDPVAFGRKSPKDQFDLLKALAPGVDFDAIADARQTAFEKRTAANRRAEDLRAQANGITLPPGSVPAPVDLAPLEKQLGDAADHNATIERRRAKREAAETHIRDQEARVSSLRREADAIEENIKRTREELTAAGDLPAAIDVADVQAKLSAAREGNKVADAAARRRELEKQAAEREAEADALTKEIKRLDDEKAEKVAKAKMPVDGLGFGDGFITLDGQPFEQASDAQQLRASIAIAAAMNPDLRVIRVRDGSLLDDDAVQALGRFAEEHDFQVWIERVDSSGEIGFVLEDGHLKGDTSAAARPAGGDEEPI